MKKEFKRVPPESEPKRNCRFYVEFPEEFNIESFVVRSATKPKLKNGEWQDIEITFMDLVGPPSTAHRIMNLVNVCIIRKSKQSFVEKFLCIPLLKIEMKSLDPTGVEIEKWIVDIGKIISVDFGNFDYGSDDIQKIKIVLRPTDCKLENQIETL